MEGPKRAQNTTSRTSTKPSSPSGSPPSRRSSRRAKPGAARASGEPTAMSEGSADTGVEPGDEKIRDGHGKSEHGNRGQDRALHQGIVADIGGIDDELADARAGKDVLGEDRARKQSADGERQEGYR